MSLLRFKYWHPVQCRMVTEHFRFRIWLLYFHISCILSIGTDINDNLLLTHTRGVEVLVKEKRLEMCHNRATAITNRPIGPAFTFSYILEIMLIEKGYKELLCASPDIRCQKLSEMCHNRLAAAAHRPTLDGPNIYTSLHIGDSAYWKRI